ncbi:hypothetical protein [Streptomyces sp. NPDC003247]|uniref:hypothetical protein n=1 Tax=Streptomyces sp. NPDC003247 TaxID=3364677 RepID=UPI003694515D
MPLPEGGRISELSCYTTNLVAYLDRDEPGAAHRLAHAVRLAVRTDVPGGGLAFSHHRRIDRTGAGWELGYRSAADWAMAREGLRREASAAGGVLASGNTRHMPWSSQCGAAGVPHWILLKTRPDGRWAVTDHFAALLPEGEHRPYAGELTDGELRAVLTPVGDRGPAAVRDGLALGEPVPVPPADEYRWLVRQPHTAPQPLPGHWLQEPRAVLDFLAGRVAADLPTLVDHADDLWAAARHQCHRITVLADQGLLPEPAADPAVEHWSKLPQTLRFAALSAARGRPRPELVVRAFDDVIQAVSDLDRPQQPMATTAPLAARGSR